MFEARPERYATRLHESSGHLDTTSAPAHVRYCIWNLIAKLDHNVHLT